MTEPADQPQPAVEAVKNTIVASITSEGGVDVSTSGVGILNAEGDATVSQSGAGAIVTRGDAAVHQSGSAAIVANSVGGDRVYNLATVAREVSVSRSWIGVALSPKMQVSEDSRVIVGPVAALIIVVALLGAFGIVAAVGVVAAKRALAWRPKVPSVSWHRMGE